MNAKNPTTILDGIETRHLRDETGREIKGALWVRRDDVAEALMKAAAQPGSGTAGPVLANEGILFVVDVQNNAYAEEQVIKILARYGYKAHRIKDNAPVASPATTDGPEGGQR